MAGERFSEKDLLDKGFTKNAEGSFEPPKKAHPGMQVNATNGGQPITTNAAAPDNGVNYLKHPNGVYEIAYNEPSKLRRLSLKLFGEPMPKQSVRSFIKGDKIGHFQPAKMGQRVKDYQRQIREQLPSDFQMFTGIVHIRKMHFVFCPLKSFSRKKMDAIERGDIFYKNTRPDLPDNLKKLVNDAMSELVYKDDGIIVSEDDVKKYYGTGGMIILELEGY